jgi:hypothetical protein
LADLLDRLLHEALVESDILQFDPFIVETGAYWPELLEPDAAFNSADAYVYAYSSPYFGSASTIHQ